MAAAIQAVADSGLDLKALPDPFRAGAIVGSGIGGLAEFEEQHQRLLEKGPMRISPFMVPKLMINAAAGHISILYGIKGPNCGVANACASANNAIGQAFWTIQGGEADIMITGGSEAALTPHGPGGVLPGPGPLASQRRARPRQPPLRPRTATASSSRRAPASSSLKNMSMP